RSSGKGSGGRTVGKIPGNEGQPGDASAACLDWEEMITALPHPSTILDLHHRILAVNRATADLLHIPEKDIIGKKCYELFHDSHTPVPECPMEAGVAEGTTHPKKREILIGGRIFLVVCTPVRDATGSVTRFVHIATDITRQKQEETVATEITRRYRFLLEQLPCSIWSTDRDLRYTSSAGSGLKEVGLEPGQIVGLTIGEFYEGQPEREAAVSAHQRALQGEKATFESQYHGRSFVSYIEPLHNEKNEVLGTLGIAHDITEQKRSQYLLEQVNRKLSLLNSISQHDARNKITAILTYLILLEENLHDPALKGYVDKIRSIVDDLNEQIEFTRSYQNLGRTAPQWQDVTSLIGRLHAGPVRIDAGTEGLKIFADPMLGKVFENLLDNSIRH